MDKKSVDKEFVYRQKMVGPGEKYASTNDEFGAKLYEQTGTPFYRWTVYMMVSLTVFFIAPTILYHYVNSLNTPKMLLAASQCTDQCRFSLVESLPIGLNVTAVHPSTHDTWAELINLAEDTIEITSFYWSLRSSDVYPDSSSQPGEDIFQALLKAGKERGLKVRIVQSLAAKSQPNVDTEYLAAQKAAEVRDVNFKKLMHGGVLHTKMWLIDRKHLYVGSANMDWRSLTQVKELGAVIYNCSCLAQDMAKLFEVYWFLGTPDAKLPPKWPTELSTRFNIESPMNITLNATNALSYIASSPPPFCPDGRSTDVSAILDVIKTADKFVYIAVMDYFPLMIYTKRPEYWSVIDNALRVAAIDKHVNVRLLASHWNHTRPSLKYFLESLSDLTGAYPNVLVEVKFYEVPSTPEQAKIPFGRVNHNKYMVTDNTAYIGTSNWSGDYFVNTGGIGLVIKEDKIRAQLEAVFQRDWESPYARNV